MFERTLRSLSSFLGAIIGASSCGCGPGSEEIVAEYGTPCSTAAVDGTVISSETGQPIQGIEVSLANVAWTGTASLTDTVQTDSDGKWTINDGCFDTAFSTIFAHDPDGDANGGTFADTSVALTLQRRALRRIGAEAPTKIAAWSSRWTSPARIQTRAATHPMRIPVLCSTAACPTGNLVTDRWSQQLETHWCNTPPTSRGCWSSQSMAAAIPTAAGQARPHDCNAREERNRLLFRIGAGGGGYPQSQKTPPAGTTP